MEISRNHNQRPPVPDYSSVPMMLIVLTLWLTIEQRGCEALDDTVNDFKIYHNEKTYTNTDHSDRSCYIRLYEREESGATGSESGE